MSPATLTLSPQAQQFVSNDGRLEVDMPAGALTSTQVQAAGGTITLKLTQILPGSGGIRSEHLFFGTYQVQLLDASGAPVAHLALAHPLVLRYHLLPSQETLLVRGQPVYAILRGGDASTLLAGAAPTTAAKNQPSTASRLLLATGDTTGLVWSVSSNLTVDTRSSFALTASTITFRTQAPQATWGNPQDFQVDLNSGGLMYTYPLDFPPAPGGFTPTMPLTYSSGAVDENHNLQSAAPWVGQGWNLSLGSISWSQENVTPGGTNRLENIWTINDPTGISGQLIPPDLNASTAVNIVPSPLPSPYIWHTAPESHAKVNEILAGGLPCWRVFLPNGVIENFGCGPASRQTYIDSGGHTVVWRWDLDLMTDRFGNQIQITYQTHTNSDGSVRDATPATIAYDDPTCHDSNTRCTGTNWNPKVIITFDASRIVAHLTNTDCNVCPGNNLYRCDYPSPARGG